MQISNIKVISINGLINSAAGTVSSFVFLFLALMLTYIISDTCSFSTTTLLSGDMEEHIKDVLVDVSLLSGIGSFGFSIYLSCVACDKAFSFMRIQLSKPTNQELATDADVFTWSMIGVFLLVFIIGGVASLFNPNQSFSTVVREPIDDIAPSTRTDTDAKISNEIENLFSVSIPPGVYK